MTDQLRIDDCSVRREAVPPHSNLIVRPDTGQRIMLNGEPAQSVNLHTACGRWYGTIVASDRVAAASKRLLAAHRDHCAATHGRCDCCADLERRYLAESVPTL